MGLEEDKLDSAKLELFWKGFRDYAAEYKECKENFFVEYKRIIKGIRDAVRKTKLRMRDNYYSDQDREKIFNELRNTEIDAAIFTEGSICLVEAKRKEKLGSNGKNILAHQLIRQRVMIEVLKALQWDKRDVFMFVVCDSEKVRSIERMEQLKALNYWEGKCPHVISWPELLVSLPASSTLQQEVESILSLD
ncbi:MAG: hypothetical protein K9L56_08790 [Clostridiales bacterium]|nr:hypothetical protein [Clostridiales bacterium]